MEAAFYGQKTVDQACEDAKTRADELLKTSTHHFHTQKRGEQAFPRFSLKEVPMQGKRKKELKQSLTAASFLAPSLLLSLIHI